MQPITNIDKTSNAFTYRESHTHRRDIVEGVLVIAESFVVGTLTIRFILALLGANSTNSFAHFINSFTTPLTNPFYGLFNYDHPSVGETVFEGYTLVAIVMYTLFFCVLVKVTQITRYEQ